MHHLTFPAHNTTYCNNTCDIVVFSDGSDSKESACNAGDSGFDPELRKVLWRREWQTSSCQYSCLKNSTDRGAWWAIVHGVTKNWTRISNSHTHTCTHTHTHTHTHDSIQRPKSWK